jgi:phosphatidylserine/phosphatidylglycerophosphate/cardiolipin synthase-like enzyme
MHAKYFIVDGDEAFVGSQNFDWRALDHIVEMGLHIRLPAYARALLDVFEHDWNRGYVVGTLAPDATSRNDADEDDAPASDVTVDDIAAAEAMGLIDHPSPIAFTSRSGDVVTLYPAFSPHGDIPNPADWDLPLIVETIDAAEDSVHVTLLSYKPVTRDSAYWPALENALRRAAARGAAVHMLVADWGKRAPGIDYLKSLQCVPGIEVRMVTIPEASSGFIPFARVTHAKYLTVDGRRFWLGTSNWEKSYFTTSRNVGVVADHPGITQELDRSFHRVWSSPYSYLVDPAATYEPPRISG